MATLTPASASVSASGKRNRVQLSSAAARVVMQNSGAIARSRVVSVTRKIGALHVYTRSGSEEESGDELAEAVSAPGESGEGRDAVSGGDGGGTPDSAGRGSGARRGWRVLLLRVLCWGSGGVSAGGCRFREGCVYWGGTQYVRATHWTALLDDVRSSHPWPACANIDQKGEVMGYFDQGEDEDGDVESEPEASLIFNADAPPTRAGLLGGFASSYSCG
ncbi:hypothetical protein EYC84_011559 [Monilinia fructicola]|uniref:Uncharacterized protein n=1 Tax=Monilinia fructicola TaxID=38448 RepID=A0A5M9J9V0_MONFR|nr:hypothetical protein EYC84_011559 [Monilinia fructicola]